MIQTNEKKYKENFKMIVSIIFLFIICLTTFFLYKNGFDILDKKSENQITIRSIQKIPLKIEDNKNILSYKKNFLHITDGKIKAIDLKGNSVFEINNQLANSIVYCNDKYIFIWEKDGKNIEIYQNDSLILKKELSGVIKNAKLFDENIIVNCNEGNLNKVLVYDTKCNLVLSKEYLEDEYIMDYDYNNKLLNMVVLTVQTRSDKLGSKIDVFDLSGDINRNSIPKSSPLKQDMLASNIKIFDNGNIVLIADDRVISIDGLGNQKWLKNLANSKIFSVNISSGKYVILEYSKVKNLLINKREITTLNNEGKEIGRSISIKSPIKSLDIKENFSLICDQKYVYSVSNGTVISKYPIKNTNSALAIDNKILLINEDGLEVIDAN